MFLKVNYVSLNQIKYVKIKKFKIINGSEALNNTDIILSRKFLMRITKKCHKKKYIPKYRMISFQQPMLNVFFNILFFW